MTNLLVLCKAIEVDCERRKCPLCNIVFSINKNKTVHMLTHRNKSCYRTVCGVAFARRHNRNSHLLTHTNVRPFCCDFCKKTFTQRSNLKRHTVIHIRKTLNISNRIADEKHK